MRVLKVPSYIHIRARECIPPFMPTHAPANLEKRLVKFPLRQGACTTLELGSRIYMNQQFMVISRFMTDRFMA